MIYRFALAIPANTTKLSLEEQTAVLTLGLINQVDIVFPPGCAALAGVRILHHGVQIWPTNPGAWFASDGERLSFREDFAFIVPPAELLLQGYNNDDAYQHTIIFRFGVSSSGIPPAQRPWEETDFGASVMAALLAELI